MVLRLGGFHMAMSFLACIGKLYDYSGIAEIMQAIYGSSSVNQLLHGRSYNRGVRAHKLLKEALERLRWKAFSEWLSTPEGINAAEQIDVDDISQLLDDCLRAIAGEDTDFTQSAVKDLTKALPSVHNALNTYVSTQTKEPL